MYVYFKNIEIIFNERKREKYKITFGNLKLNFLELNKKNSI